MINKILKEAGKRTREEVRIGRLELISVNTIWRAARLFNSVRVIAYINQKLVFSHLVSCSQLELGDDTRISPTCLCPNDCDKELISW